MWKIIDIARWILKNRKGKAFFEYSSTDILKELTKCKNNLSMLVTSDDGINITGVVTYDKKPKAIFVRNVLASKPNVLKQMLQCFLQTYPGWTIEANRHLKLKQIKNIPRLISKL